MNAQVIGQAAGNVGREQWYVGLEVEMVPGVVYTHPFAFGDTIPTSRVQVSYAVDARNEACLFHTWTDTRMLTVPVILRGAAQGVVEFNPVTRNMSGVNVTVQVSQPCRFEVQLLGMAT